MPIASWDESEAGVVEAGVRRMRDASMQHVLYGAVLGAQRSQGRTQGLWGYDSVTTRQAASFVLFSTLDITAIITLLWGPASEESQETHERD